MTARPGTGSPARAWKPGRVRRRLRGGAKAGAARRDVIYYRLPKNGYSVRYIVTAGAIIPTSPVENSPFRRLHRPTVLRSTHGPDSISRRVLPEAEHPARTLLCWNRDSSPPPSSRRALHAKKQRGKPSGRIQPNIDNVIQVDLRGFERCSKQRLARN